MPLPLPHILAATAAITPTPPHTQTYMGGTHTFHPLAPATTLTIPPGHTQTIPATAPHGGEIRLSAIMTPPPPHTPTHPHTGHGFTITTHTDTIHITLLTIPATDHIYDHDRLSLTISGTTTPTPQTITIPATQDKYTLGKNIAITLAINPSTQNRTKATLLGGRTQTHTLWHTDTLPLPHHTISAIGFTASPQAPLTVTRAALTKPSTLPHHTPLDTTHINTAIATATDPYSGYWTILDYTLEATMLRPGGDYLLALIPAPDNGYDIIYIHGATVNPSQWPPGSHKGHLTPTHLPGLYRATWTDAEGRHLDTTATLQFTGTHMAHLTLPALHSTIRLHRTNH